MNHWKDFGGMPQYLMWLGIQGGVEEFYRSPEARAAYRNRSRACSRAAIRAPAACIPKNPP